MRRTWLMFVIAGGVSFTTSLFAAGPAHRSLHALGRPASIPATLPSGAAAAATAATSAGPGAAASRGISQSASDTARMTNGFSRASGSMSRVPSVAGNHPTGAGQRPLPQNGIGPSALRGPDAVRAAAQQTLDHRLAEADRLTELAKKNGNEQLSATADRMRLQAQQHFDVQVQRADGMPLPADGQPPGSVTPATANLPVNMPANVPAVKPTWRDRLHLASPFGR